MLKFQSKITVTLVVFFASLFLFSCVNQPARVSQKQYVAEIKVTSYGIPHIKAADFGSLGFGEGYMAAKDHVCNIAYSIIEARGERSKYFGVGEQTQIPANPDDDYGSGNPDNKIHLSSDIVIRALGIPQQSKANLERQSEENQAWVKGYADGYNKYIRQIGRDNITSWCKGADWVREITPADLYSRFQVIAQTTPHMADIIVSAKPPTKEKQNSPTKTAFNLMALDTRHRHLDDRKIGSNGWAFGSDRTENGRGMLLGNPHFPWSGTDRFWEKHLIIPGKLDIYGVQIIGATGIGMGFNEYVGWTHTVSPSKRVVFYELDLVPGDPTSYYYDGTPRKMIKKRVNIPVKDKNGLEEIQEHTIWFSHYGPMASLPGAEWTSTSALTLRDANLNNHSLMDQWKDMAMSKDMTSFKTAFKKWNAVPWVNTIATSTDGRAVFVDGSNVGRLSEEAIAIWREKLTRDPLTKTLYQKMGIILLDGSDSRFEWQPHPEARAPGIVPFVEQPQQDRTDYIFNANDSYWLTNLDEPLRGYSPLFGLEDTGRSLRTRMNALLVSDTSTTGSEGRLSLKEMQRLLLSNRNMSAELLLDDLVKVCIAKGSVLVDGNEVDLTAACRILQGYDKKLDLDSKGAVLFREWISQYEPSQTRDKGNLFDVAFDAKNPITTPRNLADKELALQKLGRAVLILQSTGIALNSSLGEVQFAYRAGQKIATHGGNNMEGVANINYQFPYYSMAPQVQTNNIEGSTFLTDKGYPITGGASFLFALSYTDTGPVAEAVLTYGQSGDPTSPHYTDQAKLFSKKQWRPILYTSEDINNDTKSSFVLSGPR